MNLESNIQLIVTVITAIITLSYLWKTRVIGADKELLNKYKDGYAEYKEKYKSAVKKIAEYDQQLDMMKVRLAKADERLLTLEGQPYRPNNTSLMEVQSELNQTI